MNCLHCHSSVRSKYIQSYISPLAISSAGSPAEGALVPASLPNLCLCLLVHVWPDHRKLPCFIAQCLGWNKYSHATGMLSLALSLCVCECVCARISSVKRQRHIICLNYFSAARPHSRPAAAFIWAYTLWPSSHICNIRDFFIDIDLKYRFLLHVLSI